MSDDGFRETELPDPYVGTVVQNKFRFVRKLGEGGMGSVYEGINTAIQRKVAIKCLHAHLARDANVVYRFRNEAVAAAKIGNEHIVDVLDMGQLPDGAYFLVLEFLDGTDLAALLEKEEIVGAGRVVRIVRQVLSALDAAHQANIIHRDIKPENVYLVKRSSGADFVKLLDFGIAKVGGGDAASMKTATGTQLGTPYYMPPEQAMGHKDIDSRADLYATGVMIYHCLTGRFPFEGDSLPMLMYNICHTEATPLQTYRPDLPPVFCAVVMRTLSKDRDFRPASAAELSALLEPYATLDDARPTRDEVNTRQLDVTGPMSSGAPKPVAASSAPDSYKTTLGASASSMAVPASAPRESQRPKLAVMLSAAGLGAVAIIGSVAVYSRDGRGTQNQTTATVTPQEPAPLGARGTVALPESHASDASASSTPTERTVTVRIHTTPPNAELLLDGQPINNPYNGQVVVTAQPRRLEANAHGYRTLVRVVTLTNDQTIELPLTAGTGREILQSSGQRTRDNGRTPLSATTNSAEPSAPSGATATNMAPENTPRAQPTTVGASSGTSTNSAATAPAQTNDTPPVNRGNNTQPATQPATQPTAPTRPTTPTQPTQSTQARQPAGMLDPEGP
jgi:serine/threonine protein kinase